MKYLVVAIILSLIPQYSWGWCVNGQMLQFRQTISEVQAETLELRACLVYWTEDCQSKLEADDLRVARQLSEALENGEDYECVMSLSSRLGPTHMVEELGGAISDYYLWAGKFQKAPGGEIDRPWCLNGRLSRPWTFIGEIEADRLSYSKCIDRWARSCSRLYDQSVFESRMFHKMTDPSGLACLPEEDDGSRIKGVEAWALQNAVDRYFETYSEFFDVAP